MNCKYCGIETSGKICQTCRKYIREGNKFYEPPQKGEVGYADDGKLICHICGMAYNKLGEHVKKKHKIKMEEYRKMFGLKKSAQLTAPEYHNKISKKTIERGVYEENFKDVMGNGPKRCNKSRKGQKQSLQEINERREDQRRKGSLSKTKISKERFEELKIIWAKNFKRK